MYTVLNNELDYSLSMWWNHAINEYQVIFKKLGRELTAAGYFIGCFLSAAALSPEATHLEWYMIWPIL